jgi:hypothetical protein
VDGDVGEGLRARIVGGIEQDRVWHNKFKDAGRRRVGW